MATKKIYQKVANDDPYMKIVNAYNNGSGYGDAVKHVSDYNAPKNPKPDTFSLPSMMTKPAENIMQPKAPVKGWDFLRTVVSAGADPRNFYNSAGEKISAPLFESQVKKAYAPAKEMFQAGSNRLVDLPANSYVQNYQPTPQEKFNELNPVQQFISKAQTASGRTLFGEGYGNEYTRPKEEAPQMKSSVANVLADLLGGGMALGLNPAQGVPGASLLGAGNQAGSKILSKVTPKVSDLISHYAPVIGAKTPQAIKNIGFTAAEGAASMPVFSGYESLVNKDTPEQALKRQAEGALMGAAGGAVFGAGGALFNKLKGTNPTVSNPLRQATKSIIKPTTLPKSKYIVSTKSIYDKAMSDFEDAVQTIHNKYSTYDLNVAEQKEAEKILRPLINRVSEIEKLKGADLFKNISEYSKMKQVAGVGSEKLTKIRKNIELTSMPSKIKGTKLPSKPQGAVPEIPTKLMPDKFNLPDDVKQLKSIIKDMTNKQNKGLEIDLQRFAAAQNKLGVLQPTNVNVVSGQSKDIRGIIQKGKDLFSKKYTEWVDKTAPINKFDKDTGMLATNAQKVGGTVDHVITKNLVDTSGTKIGESLKSIINSVPKNSYEDFRKYLLYKHNAARFKEGKPIFPDVNSNQSIQIAHQYETTYPEFRQLSRRLDKFMDTFSKSWLKDTGLVSDKLLADLRAKYPHYVPTQREISALEGGGKSGTKVGFVDQGNTIKKATGSELNVIDPFENIMNLVNRTVRTARRNEVAQSIVKALDQRPELSKYAKILPDKYTGSLNKPNIVRVLVDGEKKYLKVYDQEFLDAITGIADSGIQGDKLARKVNSLFKGLITQYNPLFAIRNIARDLPTSYIYGSNKNPVTFAGQYIGAAKDIIKGRKGSKVKQQYEALGGSSHGFFASDKSTKSLNELRGIKTIPQKASTPLTKVIEGIGKFNAVTEEAPRLAEFKRVLKKTGDPQKALYAAGEVTVNFSRGGAKSKRTDIYVPYFNASLQGLDRFARMAKNNPKGLIGKAALAITTPTIFQEIWNSKIDPEGYKTLDNRTKDNYYVLATGNTDTPFIKLPKSREIAVLFSSLLQRVYRGVQGQEESFKDFINTVATNFSPTNPIENNLLSPVLNLRSNKDFANRDIVPQSLQYRPKDLQYDEKTTEIAKQLGKASGISPKQIDYIIKSYSGVIGQFGIPLNVKSSSGGVSKVLKSSFVADPTYSNIETNKFYENITKLKEDALRNNIENDIPAKKVTDQEKISNLFGQGGKVLAQLRDKINTTQDESEQKQLRIKMNTLSEELNDFYKTNPTRRQIERKYNEVSKLLKIVKKTNSK